MIVGTKSEWFDFKKPIGEPKEAEKWTDDYYNIERKVDKDGIVVWFGCSVNWRKINGTWQVLGVDENVKPTKTFFDSKGNIDGHSYPESRIKWFDCDTPIYEVMYKKLTAGVDLTSIKEDAKECLQALSYWNEEEFKSQPKHKLKGMRPMILTTKLLKTIIDGIR
jgi:hypothetical protein